MIRVGQTDRNGEWNNHDGDNRGNPCTISLYTSDPDKPTVFNRLEYEPIGYILPGDADNGGGKVYSTRQEAGTNSVAAYVKRTVPQRDLAAEIDALRGGVLKDHNALVAQREYIERLEKVTFACRDLIDDIRSNQTLFSDRIENIDKTITLIIERLEQTVGYNDNFGRWKTLIDSVLGRRIGVTADDRGPELVNLPMTFYDHAFIAAYFADGPQHRSGDRIKIAHEVATTLTAARHPAKDA